MKIQACVRNITCELPREVDEEACPPKCYREDGVSRRTPTLQEMRNFYSYIYEESIQVIYYDDVYS